MAGNTNFLVFNEANDPSRTFNDSEYTNATQRANGVIPGMALSRMHNKMYYQWSSMCRALAVWITQNGYDAMDNDINGIVASLRDVTKDMWYLIRQNSTAYAVNDIAFSTNLPSNLYLVCTSAGTSASTEPSWTGAAEGGNVTDGTVTWQYRSLSTKYAPINSPAFTGTPTAPTPTSGDDSTKLATTAFVQSAVSSGGGVPIGTIISFAGSSTPDGFLLCDGSAVSRSTYSALFAVIGTTYGGGDGSTTFNLPNTIDKFLEGSSTAGTVKSAGLPNIHGRISVEARLQSPTGPFSTFNASSDGGYNGGGDNPTGIDFNASKANSIYSDSVTTVQPPALTTRFIIRYE